MWTTSQVSILNEKWPGRQLHINEKKLRIRRRKKMSLQIIFKDLKGMRRMTCCGTPYQTHDAGTRNNQVPAVNTQFQQKTSNDDDTEQSTSVTTGLFAWRYEVTLQIFAVAVIKKPKSNKILVIFVRLQYFSCVNLLQLNLLLKKPSVFSFGVCPWPTQL